jgi:hypothetical protein
VSEDVLIAKLNLIASEIKHEDDLIGQSTTWLVISQSFLIGPGVGLAAAQAADPGAALGNLLPVAVALGFALAWVAIMITLGVV